MKSWRILFLVRMFGLWGTSLALALLPACGEAGDGIAAELRELAAGTEAPEETLLRCDALRPRLAGTPAEGKLLRIETEARARRAERDRDRDREACLTELARLRKEDPLRLHHGDRIALLETAAGLSDDPSGLHRRIAASEKEYRQLLLGHWDFKEETGNATARDSSAHDHHGTLKNGAVRSRVKGEPGIRLEGTGDHVEFPVTPALRNLNQGSYTLSLWYRPARMPGGSITPPEEKPSELTDQFGLLMRSGYHEGLSYSYQGRFIMYHWLQEEQNAISVTWDSYFPVGRFHHVVGVVDREQGTVSVYVNGRGDHTVTHPRDAVPRDYEQIPWRLGVGAPSSGTYPWPSSGTFRDVRVYGRALNREEVRKLYTHDRREPAASGDLVGHWTLDGEPSTNLVRDSSPYRHHGYSIGALSSEEGGLRLDGQRDYLQFPDTPALDEVNEGDFTLSVWFRPDRVPASGEAGLLVKAGGRAGLVYNEKAEFAMRHHLADGSWAGAGTWEEAYQPGRFYHVVGVVDRSSGQTRLYVDGHRTPANQWTPGSPATPTGIQCWKAGVVAPYEEGPERTGWAAGILDDLRIYRRALSDEDVRKLYAEARPR